MTTTRRASGEITAVVAVPTGRAAHRPGWVDGRAKVTIDVAARDAGEVAQGDVDRAEEIARTATRIPSGRSAP
jgi:pterin-4a-carbinolamine dehydratase